MKSGFAAATASASIDSLSPVTTMASASAR